ncbi:MAG: FtsX-like permease family protein [Acidobacteriota bacterium]|nr:FtsX-like permease family protein [Acidobacteriota bacterium]
MFLKFILRALKYRKQRLILAFAALAVAAMLATVLFGIYGSVERRLHDTFRAYGANLVAVPANGGTLPLAIAEAAEKMGADAAPFLITSVQIGSKTVPVAGFIPAKTKPLTPYWKTWGTCMAGSQLGLKAGQTVPEVPGCAIDGILSTGGPEDGELLVPLETAQNMANLPNAASIIQIRAPGERLGEIQNALQTRYPIAQFREVRAIADTENAVIVKVRTALFLLTLLILTITTLCVSSNFSEMVMERAKEIGILKALGAAERRIAAFFLSESAALAIVATVAGYIAGTLAAAAIGEEIFGVGFHVEANWLVFATVAIVMMVVAAAATSIAASRIWNIEPAVILRGE